MRLVIALVLGSVCAVAQRATGELRITVTDPAGLGLAASGTVRSLSTQDRRDIVTGPDGHETLTAIPFGHYVLTVESPGFAPFRGTVDIRSEVPIALPVKLTLKPVETAVSVTESETLLDASQAGSANYLGPESLRNRKAAAAGRSVIDLVNSQPGWLLEANGVLHPRGSEYGVQYVIDGLPIFDNRSPAFAQLLSADEFQSMRILTGGYPAEYGHKLGGVVEVTTERVVDAGFHGTASVEGGSFSAVTGFASGQYRWKRTTVGASAELLMTDRYLDPPVEQNSTNHGSGGAGSVKVERDWSDDDRTSVFAYRQRTGFQVPNELLQQTAGQREDRESVETSGQFSHSHIFSPSLIGTVQGRVRDTSALLWSNGLSTPIEPSQDRGFREWYGSASLSGHAANHEWKAGIEALHASIHERFDYRITAYEVNGIQVFDDAVPESFAFADRGSDSEQSGFVQDSMRWGRLTIGAGVRWDRYRLRTAEQAVSPRLSAAWSVPSAGLSLRAAYDRVFQTPAIENVLLSSAGIVDSLGGTGVFLPLKAARGNFFETGFSKTLLNRLRVDGTYFHRSVTNLPDDDVLLNTGVSFPVAFASGTVYGFEAKLEMPRWGPVSGFVSWSNMVGRGRLPIAGGLFLGDEAAGLAQQRSVFAITQDQRNSVRGRLRSDVGRRAWVAFGGTYNSGLPVELEGAADPQALVQQYGPAIVSRVNFDRGRVLPSWSLDASAGAELWRHERHRTRLQADVLNLTDRLNVINFAGLFSGTAIEPRRSFAVRLVAEF